MLEQPNHTGERQGSITVVTGHGQASFQRLKPDQAYLDVEYGQSALRADLTRQPLAGAVAALCDEEVARMREALGAVAGSLARQVGQEGLRPVIDRRWEQKDVRDWTRTATDFQVQATHTRMRDELNGYEGASDAQLIQETVRLMMEQREQGIRDVYRRILLGKAARQDAPEPVRRTSPAGRDGGTDDAGRGDRRAPIAE